MKKGDLVEVVKVSHWGGRRPTGEHGINVRKKYTAYEKRDSQWEVLISGNKKVYSQHLLNKK